jgi:hypothetical protein
MTCLHGESVRTGSCDDNKSGGGWARWTASKNGKHQINKSEGLKAKYSKQASNVPVFRSFGLGHWYLIGA